MKSDVAVAPAHVLPVETINLSKVILIDTNVPSLYCCIGTRFNVVSREDQLLTCVLKKKHVLFLLCPIDLLFCCMCRIVIVIKHPAFQRGRLLLLQSSDSPVPGSRRRGRKRGGGPDEEPPTTSTAAAAAGFGGSEPS